MYGYICVYMCVYDAHAHRRTHMHVTIHTHCVYGYMHMHVCVCVCVCVCTCHVCMQIIMCMTDLSKFRKSYVLPL